MTQLSKSEIDDADAIIILTDHDDFDYDLIAGAEAFVLDTRNRLGGRRDTL